MNLKDLRLKKSRGEFLYDIPGRDCVVIFTKRYALCDDFVFDSEVLYARVTAAVLLF